MVNPNIKNYGFGTRSKEFDDAARAKSHETPQNRWTKDKCVSELNDILDILKKILKDDDKLEKDDKRKLKNETIRDVTTLMNKFLDYMRYLYPPVQTNMNINIEMTSQAVIERLKNWKKKKMEEEGIVVEIVDEKQTEQSNQG